MHQRHWLREYFEALLIAGIFLGFTNTFLVKTFYIPSGSMKTTLLIGDHLFVNRMIFAAADETTPSFLPARPVARGDVVIFRSKQDPTTDLVKRCIGVGGDTIEIVRKQLYVNGEKVEDDVYTQHVDERVFPDRPMFTPQARRRDNFGPMTVPEGHYFFLGDNRDESYDSRFWGAVPAHYVKGRALLVYWSFGGETPDGEWHGMSHKVGQVMRTTTGFFTETRWDRTFHVVR